MEKKCRVAIYCRLSEEDRNKGEAESESIQNQKEMLRQYADEQNWEVTGVYCDEDYAGSDRSRPAFNRLLRDAKAGRMDIILCKSQSRFTRELELVEKYLHDLFPKLGIRFIGYADHADTANHGNKKARQINGLVNEWYLEDLSENIKTVFRTKQRNGQFIGSFAPYGYRKSEQDKNLLIPDDPAAEVVRGIYESRRAGKSITAIAADLNKRRLPNPSTYKEQRFTGFHRAGMYKTEWSTATVRAILKNPVYAGNMRQHVHEKISYKSNEIRSIPAQEQILVENTHQALVSKELWKAVQIVESGKERTPHGNNELQAVCRCGVCGRIPHIRYSHGKRYFTCRLHKVLIREEVVAQVVLAGKEEKRAEADVKKTSDEDFADKITLRLLQKNIQTAYEDMINGIICREQFDAMNADWQRRWTEVKKQQNNYSEKETDEESYVIVLYPRERRGELPKIEKISMRLWQKTERQGMVSTMPPP